MQRTAKGSSCRRPPAALFVTAFKLLTGVTFVRRNVTVSKWKADPTFVKRNALAICFLTTGIRAVPDISALRLKGLITFDALARRPAGFCPMLPLPRGLDVLLAALATIGASAISVFGLMDRATAPAAFSRAIDWLPIRPTIRANRRDSESVKMAIMNTASPYWFAIKQ
jgi:hypothetical protein